MTNQDLQIAASDSTFITASVLCVEPASAFYSIHGHEAIRLQCPSAGLDYCFSFEVNPAIVSQLSFLTTSQAGFMAVDYQSYIHKFSSQKRGIQEFVLNLSPVEKQNLWKIIDDYVDDGMAYQFDYMNCNCTSECIHIIKMALDDGVELQYGDLQQALTGTHRTVVSSMSSQSPWSALFWNFTMGSQGDQRSDIDYRITPVYHYQAWRNALLVDGEGHARPMIKGELRQVIGPFPKQQSLYPSPLLTFGTLLFATTCVSVLQLLGKLKDSSRIVKILDGFLLTAQTIVGCYLVSLLLFSSLPATTWNWYVIPYNPLPALMWLAYRRRSWYKRVYGVYSLLLTAFLLISPLLPQTNLVMCLPVVCLLIRCIAISINNHLKTQTK